MQELIQKALIWIQGLGIAGGIVFIVIYILATILFLPGSLLTLGAGAIFDVVLGSIYVFIGAVLGSTGSFLIGRYLARDWVAKKINNNPKFKAIDRAVARSGFRIVLLTRLSPIFPFNLLNYGLGITQVKLKDYLLGSIGMIPGTVMYVYLGSLVGNVAKIGLEDATKSPEGERIQWIIRIVGLIATVAVTLYVTKIARKALEASTNVNAEEKAPVKFPERTYVNTPKAGVNMSVAGSDRRITVPPMDVHNQTLVSYVHPSGWVNPIPARRYNLVVIGGGTAGLVAAAGAAGLGAKVALIERHLMGGDCLNVGCVPSKCLIRSSRTAGEVWKSRELGIQIPEIRIDFPAVMERMRKLRAGISHHDSAARFQDLGVDVFLGDGKFIDSETIEVDGVKLKFAAAVIATGARASRPQIPGIETVGYLTNETVFSLTELPRSLAVIGGGPIGCELAQAFCRFGAEVTILQNSSHILDKEDKDAAEIIQNTFIYEGIKLIVNSQITKVEASPSGKTIHYEVGGQLGTVTVDEILVAAGRSPNVEGLNLEGVGVKYDTKKGVIVNDRLQTSNSKIYAAGDVCMDWKFTHAADAAARIVIQNALFLGRKKLSSVTMPWCTYTDPEIAHVGMYEKDAKAKGIELDTYFIPMNKVDRAIADGETGGFVKIHTRKGKDKILGATIVASHAGDMISEVTLAMVGNVGLKTLANVIHPYPTQAEAIRKAAEAYNRTRLTPLVKDLFSRWLAWRR